MADSAAPQQSFASHLADLSVFVGTFALIGLAIVLFLALDLSLARIDRSESAAHAASDYEEGVALLARNEPAKAIDRFASAVAIDRRNVNYTLALGQAKLQAGQPLEAQATITPLLDRAGNDGAVNLTMAHVMLRQQRIADAKAYFHRAIFGRWAADSLARRREARFELIDLLARSGSPGELLAELLPFEETSPDSTALRRRLGALFITAGSPARAADMYREVIRRDPTDAEAFAGMGEAALALGNFRTARSDFSMAARLRPDDARIAARFALADTVASLDPTAAGIGATERLARSRRLLEHTRAAMAACPVAAQAAGTTVVPDSARVLAGGARPPDRALSDAEMVRTAEALWSSGSKACPAAGAVEVLRLVFARLIQ
jgi:tetratricopeptide (TPR) repeat protein